MSEIATAASSSQPSVSQRWSRRWCGSTTRAGAQDADRDVDLLLGAIYAGFITVLLLASTAMAADNRLAPFGTGPVPAAPWRVVGLPAQKAPLTTFTGEVDDGIQNMRVEAHASYGNLVHPLPTGQQAAGLLSWRWRVDHLIDAADLRTKRGDDVSLKICALFDLPLASVPFLERQLMRLARLRTGEPLPAATLCYVWDAHLPTGTALPNAFSRRVRYVVLRTGAQELGTWQSEQRDLTADFLKFFADEAHEVPPLMAIGIGADADNTAGYALSFVADLQLR